MRFRFPVSLILVLATTIWMNAQSKTYSILFLGDSYTIGEGVTADQNYPSQLIVALKKEGIAIGKYKIIAKTGWTTGELLENLLLDDEDIKYDLVFLCIGVNNQYRGMDIQVFKKELNTLVNSSIVYSGNQSNHVVLVSIPDYGFTPFGAAKKDMISKELDAYNLLVKENAANVNGGFADITPISRSTDKQLVAPDDLHPSATQYGLWVKQMLPMVIGRLK